MTIEELQKKTDDWIKTYGVKYFDPMTNLAILNEEVGELSSLMARVYGQQSFKRKEDEVKAPENIKKEIADILFVLVCLSNQMDIDINDAILQSFEKKTKRDKDRHINNPKLYER